MVPGLCNIDDVFTGCAWGVSIAFLEDDGVTPLNLTGYTIEVEFVAGAVVVDLTRGSGLTVTDNPATVAIALTAVQIASLGGANTLVDWSMYWTSGGSRYKVLTGLAPIGQGPRT